MQYDPEASSDDDSVYSDPVDQLHNIQDSANEAAIENGGDEQAIFNEVANDFYGFE